MKMINSYISTIVCNIIISFFFGIFLFIFPAQEVNAISEPPMLTLTSPMDNSLHNTTDVKFTGTVSDDITPNENLRLNAIIDPYSLNETIPITINTNGSWTMTKSFSEGTHQIKFELMDSDNNIIEQTITINVDKRPYITSIKIAPPGITDENLFLPAEDMTKVPKDSKIIVTINESSTIGYTNFLSIILKDGDTSGGPKAITVAPPIRNIDGEWEITITPDSPFLYNKTYFVYVNPYITDAVGNKLFPKFFKFSTESDKDPEDGHGKYMANTQACANCHSTHTATANGLQGGKYGKVSTSNYCMACHDGTAGAPIIKDFNMHKHQQLQGEKTGTCTSCHNPHPSWSKENPNRLKDHYVFDHQGTTMNPPRIVNSDVELCESCHQDAGNVKTQTHYRVLTYKKSMTATGNSDDFTLCFQCHEGNKASNILQFYSNPAIIANSGHNIKATDGSPLNGQMPCADCHVTHGSDNNKGLKTKLGHVEREDVYSTTSSTEWTAFDERQFCLKCHNNSIEMYGEKATLLAKDSNGVDIPEHDPANVTACSSCHAQEGEFPEQSFNAAHAPKKLTTSGP